MRRQASGKSKFLLAGASLVFASSILLGGCNQSEVKSAETPVEAAPVSALDAAISNPARAKKAARDVFRHPKGTLEFFQVTPDLDVLEIAPNGGYYADILQAYIATGTGSYAGTRFATDEGFFGKLNKAMAEEYPDMVTYPFSKGVKVPEAIADRVLTFRNVHNWMAAGWAEEAFSQFYTALRPGGMLGVVEHRLPATAEQNPLAPSGYVQQVYTIKLAEEAGFTFVGSSEVNANPKDTADHPKGVWMLPPTLREGEGEGYDKAKYEAIGESDRFTLLFVKAE